MRKRKTHVVCSATFAAMVLVVGIPASAGRQAAPLDTAFPLKVSDNRGYLVDQAGRPFFVMGDTPWFIQKLKLEDMRMLINDRVAKGFNTLFIELLDDSRIPSRDGYGNAAFETDTDLTRPAHVNMLRLTQEGDGSDKCCRRTMEVFAYADPDIPLPLFGGQDCGGFSFLRGLWYAGKLTQIPSPQKDPVWTSPGSVTNVPDNLFRSEIAGMHQGCWGEGKEVGTDSTG